MFKVGMSTFFRKKMSVMLIFVLLLFASSPLETISAAIANSASTNMNINASVVASCSFTQVNTLNFGAYDPTGPNNHNPLDTATTIQLSCTKNTNATIKMNTGLNSSHASGTSRALYTSINDDYLNYEIYTDAGRTTVWNESTGTYNYIATSAAPATINVYGRIPGNQHGLKGGTYTDTVTITASF